MATGSEVKKVIQNILSIRKTEVQVRTALVELGLEENISESMFDLVGAAFSLGYERGRAEGKVKVKAVQPEAEPEAETPTNGDGIYTIKDAIIDTLQQGAMNAAEIHQKLAEQGRTVNRKSVATALCSYKDTFVSDAEKGRGYYRVVSNEEPVHVSVASAVSAIAKYFPTKPFQAHHLAEKMGCTPRNLGVILRKLWVDDGFLRVAKKPEGDFPGQGKIWEVA